MRKSKLRAHEEYRAKMEGILDQDPLCPLCGRPIPPSQQDEHHLVPKSKNGKETKTLHRVCHRQIHALFTENELAKRYCSPEALLEHPQIQEFVRWVSTKPNDFCPKVRASGKIRDYLNGR